MSATRGERVMRRQMVYGWIECVLGGAMMVWSTYAAVAHSDWQWAVIAGLFAVSLWLQVRSLRTAYHVARSIDRVNELVELRGKEMEL